MLYRWILTNLRQVYAIQSFKRVGTSAKLNNIYKVCGTVKIMVLGVQACFEDRPGLLGALAIICVLYDRLVSSLGR